MITGGHVLIICTGYRRFTCDISAGKIKFLEPENIENDVLHMTFGHVVKEI